MARFALPGIGGLRHGSGLLEMLAGGPIGRLLAPLTPLLLLLGMRDRSNYFVLNIGDEGATLVQLRGGQVVDAVFAEAAAEEGWDALREMLLAEPGAQIIVIADVLEQMFREDTVPKVGIFDRGKIVKRRLDLTFPNDLLKAALPLARQRGAPQSVLFTALPLSEHLGAWVKFLDQFPNQVRGFYMLPLEGVGLAKRLAPTTEGETRRVWRALISQEAASGFRQVFESGDKLVVTRLTQRPGQPLTPEAEGMLIERELRSSISYIKRLGFSDADRLDVVILADPAVCRAVDERDLPATTVTAYTPYQAGILLGLGETGREDSPFADVLLGLWIARKKKKLIALPTPKIFQQLRIESITRWSGAATAALTLIAGYYLLSLIAAYAAGETDIAALEKQKLAADTELATELDRVKSYPVPLDELTQVAENEERLASDEVDVVSLMRQLGKALGSNFRATQVEFTITQTPVRGAKSPAPKLTGTPYELHVTVSVIGGAANADVSWAVEQAKELQARLVTSFPGHDVQALRMPGNSMVNQTLEGTGTLTDQDHATGPRKALTAEFIIRKVA